MHIDKKVQVSIGIPVYNDEIYMQHLYYRYYNERNK